MVFCTESYSICVASCRSDNCKLSGLKYCCYFNQIGIILGSIVGAGVIIVFFIFGLTVCLKTHKAKKYKQ